MKRNEYSATIQARKARRWKLSTLIIAALIAVFSIIRLSKSAHCAWCPSYTCYSESACGKGCSCMRIQGSVGGVCVSFQRK